jgi:hypothetical protein
MEQPKKADVEMNLPGVRRVHTAPLSARISRRKQAIVGTGSLEKSTCLCSTSSVALYIHSPSHPRPRSPLWSSRHSRLPHSRNPTISDFRNSSFSSPGHQATLPLLLLSPDRPRFRSSILFSRFRPLSTSPFTQTACPRIAPLLSSANFQAALILHPLPPDCPRFSLPSSPLPASATLILHLLSPVCPCFLLFPFGFSFCFACQIT